MSRFVVVLFSCIVLFDCACRQTSKRVNPVAAPDLFSATTDTSLFIKKPVVSTVYLTPDTAYKNSELVVLCTPLLIDSTVHQTEKAWFYLVTVKIDTTLKGKLYKGSIYFTTSKRPPFITGTTGCVIYLSRQKTGKLLTYNDNVPWQWLENAPCEKYHPGMFKNTGDVPPKPKKIKRKNKKPRPTITLWVFKKSPVCPATLLL